LAELDALRTEIQGRLKIGDRQLARLLQRIESATLLPRRLAVLKLAADNGIRISRDASEDELAQLREIRRDASRTASPSPAMVAASKAAAAPRGKRRPHPAKAVPAQPKPATRGRKVFVVHGRNEAIRKALFSFLRSIGLDPLEWRRAILATKKPSPSISEILDAAFSEAVAVVVLLTPDDQVILSPDFQKPSDPDYERTLVGQARPNVLFEAGLAFGRHADSTVLLQVGSVKPFSDVAGRHITRLTNSPESRAELVTKLINAGCNTETDGTDWLNEGDFDV